MNFKLNTKKSDISDRVKKHVITKDGDIEFNPKYISKIIKKFDYYPTTEDLYEGDRYD